MGIVHQYIIKSLIWFHVTSSIHATIFAAEWSYRLIYTLYNAELKKNAQVCIYSLADLNVIL